MNWWNSSFLFLLNSRSGMAGQNGCSGKLWRKGCPPGITWRKDKVGFEPPQLQWMQNNKLQEMIQDAKT
jgi:hypothetical protein